MKIKSIETFLVAAVWRNFIIVKITADNGISGYGEATMGDFEKTIEAAVNDFRPFLIGREIEIPEITNFLYRNFFWRGGPILMSAISAIDQALWDVVGRDANRPIYKLLGGKSQKRVKVYANGFISGNAPPESFASAALKEIESGFRAVKFDPFEGSGPGISDKELNGAVRRISAVREAVGDEVEIMIEAHGRFNPVNAKKIAVSIQEFNVSWLEEPVPEEDIDSMAEVRRNSPVPIATGERIVTKYRFNELLEKRAADIVQPDVCHVGGIRSLTEVGSMAQASYVNVAPHNPNGPIATASSLSALITMPNAQILEFWVDAGTLRREIVEKYFEIRDGYIEPLNGPGNGLVINEEAFMKHPYKKMHLEYFSSDYAYYGDTK